MRLWQEFLRIFLIGIVAAPGIAGANPVFRLHLYSEPANLTPYLQKSSTSSYLLQNIYRNIFFYSDEDGLRGDLGESCKRESPLVLVCKLKKDLKWSDGSPLTASDFLKTYRRILDPSENAPRADLLFKIKNAPAIYKKQKKIEMLGISAPNATTLRFEFEEKDPDFEYSLASTQLAPIKNSLLSEDTANELMTSGPYRISKWIHGEKISLESNPHYRLGNSLKRPPVDFLFIAEDSVALQLYEKKELSLLRRLPTLYIPKYKNRSDFVWIPAIRFDYIGFGPDLKDNPKLREALTLSLNYKELQKIFSSEGVPGCLGIPKSFVNEELCYNFDLTKAKAAFKQATEQKKKLKLMYSSLGGEDHRRAAEWLQAQWNTNLQIQVQPLVRENKIFIHDLQTENPPLFRKGLAPDRPTCLAVLETFADWNPENYIQLKDPEFQNILKSLGESTQTDEKKKWCTLGFKYMMDRFYLIPTGRFDFAMLANPDFLGWKFNSMNQLDLSNLNTKTSQSKTK